MKKVLLVVLCVFFSLFFVSCISKPEQKPQPENKNLHFVQTLTDAKALKLFGKESRGTEPATGLYKETFSNELIPLTLCGSDTEWNVVGLNNYGNKKFTLEIKSKNGSRGIDYNNHLIFTDATNSASPLMLDVSKLQNIKYISDNYLYAKTLTGTIYKLDLKTYKAQPLNNESIIKLYGFIINEKDYVLANCGNDLYIFSDTVKKIYTEENSILRDISNNLFLSDISTELLFYYLNGNSYLSTSFGLFKVNFDKENVYYEKISDKTYFVGNSDKKSLNKVLFDKKSNNFDFFTESATDLIYHSSAISTTTVIDKSLLYCLSDSIAFVYEINKELYYCELNKEPMKIVDKSKYTINNWYLTNNMIVFSQIDSVTTISNYTCNPKTGEIVKGEVYTSPPIIVVPFK